MPAEPKVPCCCCPKSDDDYKMTRGLLGPLCPECREVARAGSQPVYVTRVSGVSQKTGRLTCSRTLLRAFA